MDIKLISICRVCLLNEEELTNIFNEGLAEVIMTFALVKVNHNDGLPQCICKLCLQDLNAAVRFKNKCEKSQIKLHEYINSIPNIDTQAISHENLDLFNSSFKIKTTNEVYDDGLSIHDSGSNSNSTLENDKEKLYKIITQEYFHENKTEVYSVYECVSCKRQDLSLSEFNQHTCLANISTFHTCEYCSETFEIIEKYKIHLKTHESVKIKCENCSETFQTKSELDQHLKNKHSNKPRTNKIHQCEFCGKITNCHSGLLKHMSLHTNERPFKCEKCSRSFRLRSFLNKHLLTHAGVRSHHCMFCPKSFVLKSNLSSHMKTHSGEKKYPCNVCNKKFKSSRSLHYHLKLHTGERNYPCSKCDKAFVNQFDLRRHLQLHEKQKAIEQGTYDKTSERPKQMHQCETCGKFFPSRGDLTKHFRVHNGDRPFKCQFCDKAFTGSSALTVHVRTHTGNKPYVCQHCNQSFAQSSNLKVHIRLHTGVRPYICTICNKGYNRKRDLETHLKKHVITDKI